MRLFFVQGVNLSFAVTELNLGQIRVCKKTVIRTKINVDELFNRQVTAYRNLGIGSMLVPTVSVQ